MTRKSRRQFWIFWNIMFVAAFLILGYCGYSDGDDAYFYQYTNSMGFLEYLSWRYETWVGRMAAEALVYLTFHLGLPFWRIVNAAMLVLLPLGLLYLAVRAARVPDAARCGLEHCPPACGSRTYDELGVLPAAAAVMGYFMMSMQTFGYAAVWVNGSIFYTWSFTCGIWALTTFADFIFSENPPVAGSLQKVHCSMEGCATWKFLYALPCAVIATMAIEQMAAVLLVFELLGIFYGVQKWRRVHPLLLVQTLLTVAAFAMLFLAPGNDVRVATEIVTWMPQYETMPLGQHLFITLHWLLSSFANENKLFLCAIWVAGGLLLLQKSGRSRFDRLLLVLAGVFTLAALLPYIGITIGADMGMQYIDITQCIVHVPSAAMLTGMQMAAMLWWGMALLYTVVFLWHVSGHQITLLLAYLAGIASEAILFFSPTMYASGGRVYYLTDLLYLFIFLALTFGITGERQRKAAYGFCIAGGALNFVSQLPALLAMR